MIAKRKYQFVRKHSRPTFGSSLMIPRQSCSCLFKPIKARPAAAFWGDSDGDGVYNGLDCMPHNAKLQGKIHRVTPEQREYNKMMKEAEQKALTADISDKPAKAKTVKKPAPVCLAKAIGWFGLIERLQENLK